MDSSDLVVGSVLLLVMTLPVIGGVVRLRHRFLPDVAGVSALLVDAVGVQLVLVLIGEALGSVGLFRRVVVVVVAAIAGLGLAALGSGRAAEARPASEGTGSSRERVLVVIGLLAVAVVVAQWGAATINAYQHGMCCDTLAYHGPFAARFAQDGWVTRLHYATPGEGIPFYPANAELLHAYGMLLFRSDVLSPLLNLGWLAMAFVAAFAIGRAFQAEWTATTALAVLMSAPLIPFSQGGTALNDIAVLAFMLTAVALLVVGSDRLAVVAVAGASTGFAVGSKASFIAPAAVLTIAVIVLVRERRRSAVWTAGVVVGGAFWYLRNLIRLGSPMPAVKIGIGSLSFPTPKLPVLDRGRDTLLAHLRPNTIRNVYEPGLHRAFGRLWPLIVAGAAIGIVIAIARPRNALQRVLGVAALGFAVAYAATPTTGFSPLFVTGLRFALAALSLGLVLLACSRLVREPRGRAVIAVALGLVVAGNAVPRSAWTGNRAAGIGVVVAVALVAAAALAAMRVARTLQWFPALVVVGAVMITVVVAWTLEDRSLHSRYDVASIDYSRDLGVVLRATRTLHDERIAITGFFQQYPLYGVDLSNHVQYVGHEGPHGSFDDITSCSEWRRALSAGQFHYVVTARGFDADTGEPAAAAWTRSDPAVSEVVHEGRASLFRINGPLSAGGC